jgi:hypothetical protein
LHCGSIRLEPVTGLAAIAALRDRPTQDCDIVAAGKDFWRFKTRA